MHYETTYKPMNTHLLLLEIPLINHLLRQAKINSCFHNSDIFSWLTASIRYNHEVQKSYKHYSLPPPPPQKKKGQL